MRVLAVYSTKDLLGGGEVSFTLSMELISKRGWDVVAALPALGSLSDYIQKRGIPFVILPQPSLREGFNLLRLFIPHPAWLQICRSYGPNLIHCNAVRPALYGQAVGRSLHMPTILHARNSENLGPIDVFLAARLSAILCTSSVVQRRFPAHFRSDKLKLLHNPIDIDRFETPAPNSVQLRQEWLNGQATLLVGIIGRLSPSKGQHWIIEAAPEIIRCVPEVRFVLIGSEDPSEPGYRQQLQGEICRKNLENYIVFAGFQEDMPSAYHALDVVAFPTSAEGFGRVVIEAGAARKALVTSDIEVLKEIMGGMEQELAVSLGNVTHLARRIVLLLRDAEMRREIGERLYRHVKESFGPEAHAEQLLSIYRELTDPTGK